MLNLKVLYTLLRVYKTVFRMYFKKRCHFSETQKVKSYSVFTLMTNIIDYIYFP